MKKILLTTLFTVVAAAATAETALTGLHLGVDGGLQRTSFDQALNTNNAGNDAVSKIKKPSYNWTGAASLGYFQDKDGLHYGAKFSVGKTLGRREKNATDGLQVGRTLYTDVKTKVSQEYSLALTGQLGTYVAADTVVYGLLGVKRVRYDLDLTALNVHSVKGNVGKTVWGPVFGLGMKKALSDAWAFNTEVSYEMYKKISTGNLQTPGVLAANEAIGMTIKPRIFNVTVGLSHKF